MKMRVTELGAVDASPDSLLSWCYVASPASIIHVSPPNFSALAVWFLVADGTADAVPRAMKSTGNGVHVFVAGSRAHSHACICIIASVRLSSVLERTLSMPRPTDFFLAKKCSTSDCGIPTGYRVRPILSPQFSVLSSQF